MTWINVTHPEWFKDRASSYGGQWVPVESYPHHMKPDPKEVGALVRADGIVIHRIRKI